MKTAVNNVPHFPSLTNPGTVTGGLLAVFLLVKVDLEFKNKMNKQNPTPNKQAFWLSQDWSFDQSQNWPEGEEVTGRQTLSNNTNYRMCIVKEWNQYFLRLIQINAAYFCKGFLFWNCYSILLHVSKISVNGRQSALQNCRKMLPFYQTAAC